ncbi:MAG TPA: hypothetical protein DCY59_03830 [Micrococcaceae bacterium]|nr:hypothetical protein [Micrococcaceae bacterium]
MSFPAIAQSAPASSAGLPASIHTGLMLSLFLCIAGLWLWALIDCIRNEPATGNDKIIWLLVIIFLGFIGAILYLRIQRPKRERMARGTV